MVTAGQCVVMGGRVCVHRPACGTGLRHMLIKTGIFWRTRLMCLFVGGSTNTKFCINSHSRWNGQSGISTVKQGVSGTNLGCCRSLMTLGPSLVAVHQSFRSTLEAGPDTHAALPLSPNVGVLHSPRPVRNTTRPRPCFAAHMLTDEDAALQALATLEEPSPEQQEALKAVNTILHNGEPFVDVHELFAHYNVLYFRKLLLPRVEVLWSPRLTL
jgi:hypothetical protein